MNRSNKSIEQSEHEEAFELIELATEDLQELALAFQYFSAGLRAGLPMQEEIVLDSFVDEDGREMLLN